MSLKIRTFLLPVQYLLEVEPYVPKDSKGNLLERQTFDPKKVAKVFRHYVRETENLLIANLIFIPHFKHHHHTIYVMNKYTGTLDIFDSRRYAQLKHTTRNKHHEDRVAIITRMVAVMKEVCGEAAFNKHNVVNWEMAADRCNFTKMPEQGANECGFYALKVPRSFGGIKFVEKIAKKDRRVEDWKAEYMYQLLLHPKNTISPSQWPTLLHDLCLLLSLASQTTQPSL